MAIDKEFKQMHGTPQASVFGSITYKLKPTRKID
jgi:hypothetical protein